MLSSVIIKKPAIDEKKLQQFLLDLKANQLMISPVIAKLLFLRGVDSTEKAAEFLCPDLERLHDPYLMKGMSGAVELITKHIENGDKITVYGDYDVDGVTSTTILYKTLSKCGANVSYYIPDRLSEGYGINATAVQQLIDDGAKLVISVDTGITAVEPVSLAKQSGIDMIITDHHECQDVLPAADYILNPKQPDCAYPFKGLAGVGVTYKLVQALCGLFGVEKEFELDLLEIVSVGTVADLVPLVGENRTFVYHAFLRMENMKNIGLKALFDVAGVDPLKRSAGVIGFQIGPRLNAAGRLGDAKRGVELFLTQDNDIAVKIAEELNGENQKRRDMEELIFSEADAIIAKRFVNDLPDILVVAHDGWHHGVIGIVASRITEKYYRPTILLAIEEGVASGSARSVEDFSIFDALVSTKQVFTKFGGHEMAAGMSLPEDKIEELFVNLNTYARQVMTKETLIPKVKIEEELAAEEVEISFIEALSELEPYGMGNEEPRFFIEGNVHSKELMGKEKNHFKLRLATEKVKKPIDAISFFNAHYDGEVMEEMPVGIIGTLHINEWKSYKNPQIFIKEIVYHNEVTTQLEQVKCIVSKLIEALEHDRIQAWFEEINTLSDESIRVDRELCVHVYKNLKKMDSNGHTELDLANLLGLIIDHERTQERYESSAQRGEIFFRLTEYSKIAVVIGIFAELQLVQIELLPEGILKFSMNSSKKVELNQSKLYNEMCCQNE